MERITQGSVNSLKRNLKEANAELKKIRKENSELLDEINALLGGVTGIDKGRVEPQFLICRKLGIGKSTILNWEKEGLPRSHRASKHILYDTDILSEFLFDIQDEE